MSDSVMKALIATKDKYRKQLLALSNVEAVGIGPELSNGIPTGKTAIKIFVRKKKPVENLAEEELIPSELDGFPTDVEELAPLYIHKPD